MDMLNKVKDAVGNSGNKEGNQGQQAQGGNNQQQGGGEQMDYGDKAFDFVSKKTGHSMDRNTEEKITDGARGAYEKMTGNKVDPKYSN